MWMLKMKIPWIKDQSCWSASLVSSPSFAVPRTWWGQPLVFCRLIRCRVSSCHDHHHGHHHQSILPACSSWSSWCRLCCNKVCNLLWTERYVVVRTLWLQLTWEEISEHTFLFLFMFSATVTAVVGEHASLPCELQLEEKCGPVTQITWSRNSSNEWHQILSESYHLKQQQKLQQRSKSGVTKKQFPPPSVSSSRSDLKFILDTGSSSSSTANNNLSNSLVFLKIKKVSIEDEATYKCDVVYTEPTCPSVTFTKVIVTGESVLFSSFLSLPILSPLLVSSSCLVLFTFRHFLPLFHVDVASITCSFYCLFLPVGILFLLRH